MSEARPYWINVFETPWGSRRMGSPSKSRDMADFSARFEANGQPLLYRIVLREVKNDPPRWTGLREWWRNPQASSAPTTDWDAPGIGSSILARSARRAAGTGWED